MRLSKFHDPGAMPQASGDYRAFGATPNETKCSDEIAALRLRATRRNEAANQILNGNDPAKVVLSINDCRQTEPRSAQLLHDAIGGLIVRGCYNTPHILAQRFVSVSLEQDVWNIDQPGGLAVGRKHGQTIKTGRSA